MDSPTSQCLPAASSDSWSVPASLWDREEPADSHARQQSALLAFARRAGTLPALDVLMQNAGAVVAEVLKADLYGVGEVLDGGAELEFTLAGAGPDGGGTRPLSRRGRIDPTASVAAYAIHAAAPIVASNVAQDPRFTDLFVRQAGAVSALTLPLHLGGKALGVLAVFSKRTREFAPGDVRFAEAVGHLLTASIARAKSDDETFRLRLFAHNALEMVDSLVLKLDPQGNILDMNSACRQATGFEPAEVRNQPLVNILAIPREVEPIREKLRQVRRPEADAGDAVLQFESQLLTKAGDRRRVAWSLKALRDQAGTILFLLMTGQDRTESVPTESRLGQRRRRAQGAPAPAILGGGPPDAGGTTTGNLTGPLSQAGKPLRASPVVSVGASRSYRRNPTSVAKDLRSSPRRAFRCCQRIAPTFGGQLPGKSDFFEVECEDISAGGIAFYLNRPPDFETLVVALGKPPNESYLSARVVRCVKAERDGARVHLVGCSFTGKVSV